MHEKNRNFNEVDSTNAKDSFLITDKRLDVNI